MCCRPPLSCVQRRVCVVGTVRRVHQDAMCMWTTTSWHHHHHHDNMATTIRTWACNARLWFLWHALDQAHMHFFYQMCHMRALQSRAPQPCILRSPKPEILFERQHMAAIPLVPPGGSATQHTPINTCFPVLVYFTYCTYGCYCPARRRTTPAREGGPKPHMVAMRHGACLPGPPPLPLRGPDPQSARRRPRQPYCARNDCHRCC